MSKAESIQKRKLLWLGISLFLLIRISQWFGFATIFKTILTSEVGSSKNAPLFIAVLCVSQMIGTLLLGKVRFMRKHSFHSILLTCAFLMSIAQIVSVKESWIYLFIVVTSVKSGFLANLLVWRDIVTTQYGRISNGVAHKLNSIFSSVEYSALFFGSLLGGWVDGGYGVLSVFAVETILLALAFLISMLFKPLSKSVYARISSRKISLSRLGLFSHGLRSFSDAGFQALLPIVAYKVIGLSALNFSFAVSVSGILIAVGASLYRKRLASLADPKSKFVYASLAALATFGNAIGLWISFESLTYVWFTFWLGVGSLFCGMAITMSRTIILSGLSKVQLLSSGNSIYMYSLTRYLGVFSGAIAFWVLLDHMSIPLLSIIFLGVMAFSGVILWFDGVGVNSAKGC